MSSKYIYTFVKSNRKICLSIIKSSLIYISINSSNTNDYSGSQTENDYDALRVLTYKSIKKNPGT